MRRSFVGGLLLAGMTVSTIGLAGTAMAADPPAPSEGAGTVTVVVDSSIQLSMTDSAISLQGLAGATGVTATDNQMAMNVKTNNITGYAVTVKADQADLLPGDTTANTDKIPVSNIRVTNNDDAAKAALSDTAAAPVASKDSRSIEAGDAITATFDGDIPFVNSDTYTGTITFTATAK